MRYDRTLLRVLPASIAACLLAIPLSSARADDQAEFHCAKPGTKLQFNNRGFVEFVGQEGFTCLVKVPDSKAPDGTSVSRVFLGLSTYAPWADNHAEHLWPFKVGNEVEFTSSGDSSHIAGLGTSSDRIYYRDNVKVLRQEKLVTKMGSFDTWVIEDRQISQGRLAGTWITTYWWASDLAYFVKRTYEVRAGLGTDATAEITSLTTPALASPTATSSTTPAPPPVVTPTSTPPSAPATKSAKAATTPPSTSTAPSAPAPSPPPAGSVAERLQALKDLLDRKLITPSEYEAKRKTILDAL